jgi:hypothetical protein
MQRSHLGAIDDRQPAAGLARGARFAGPEREQRGDIAWTTPPGQVDTGSATRSIGDLQHSAGNAAVAQLLAGQAVIPAPVQRELDDEDAQTDSTTADEHDDSMQLDDGGSTPAGGTGQSWTKVGPPSDAPYTVTGTLRKASEAVAARPEAGSVTTTPSLDTDPPKVAKDGTQTVPAARVTVDQVRALPVWESREGPASNEGEPTANQEAEWSRFSAAIAKHEAGHVAKDQAAFANAHMAIKGKSPTDADTAFDNISDKATADNDAYDVGNDHGRNEGTTINPNIDEVTKVP